MFPLYTIFLSVTAVTFMLASLSLYTLYNIVSLWIPKTPIKVCPSSSLNSIKSELLYMYYTKDYTAQEIQMSDTDASIIAQLAVNELGLGFSKEENAMNLGVYAKLIRSVYMKNSSPGDAILPILKRAVER